MPKQISLNRIPHNRITKRRETTDAAIAVPQREMEKHLKANKGLWL